jgi:hypothetical protein
LRAPHQSLHVLQGIYGGMAFAEAVLRAALPAIAGLTNVPVSSPLRSRGTMVCMRFRIDLLSGLLQKHKSCLLPSNWKFSRTQQPIHQLQAVLWLFFCEHIDYFRRKSLRTWSLAQFQSRGCLLKFLCREESNVFFVQRSCLPKSSFTGWKEL